MTVFEFERRYRAQWDELAQLLDELEGRKRRQQNKAAGQRAAWPAQRLTVLYRQLCEQLAASRARAYPASLIEQLDALSHRAHQVIYRQRSGGWAALARWVARDFPQAVREQWRFVAVAAALFLLPMGVVGWITFEQPSFALSVLDAQQLLKFESMYREGADASQARGAHADWAMFGHYIKNNISVGFQCFAGGLIAGIGALWALVFNGLYAGVIGGYLCERGLGESFWSFVATHAAFELTAIVLAGAAGLKLGCAWLMPGRQTRMAALMQAARASVRVMYGVVVMLVIAAAIEAFWSSARWLAPEVKYVVAALCWLGVMAYFVRQGRDESMAAGGEHAR